MYTFKNKISKKVNKDKQVEMIKDLLLDSNNLSDEQIIKLETVLFSLTASSISSAKPKSDFEWVSKAISNKKHCKEEINYIYSDGAKIVATDNKILLTVNNSGFDKGYYLKGSNGSIKADINGVYPNIDRIRRDNKGFITTKKELLNYPMITNADGVFIQINDRLYNNKYIMDALSLFDDNQEIRVDADWSLQIDINHNNKDYTAIIADYSK